MLGELEVADPEAGLEKVRKVLISDLHIGTTMWQHAMLKATGHHVVAHSLSGHRHYMGHDALIEAPVLQQLHNATDEEITVEFRTTASLEGLTHALCSFPPSRAFQLARLPETIRILVNVGHRIHIHVPGDRLVQASRAFAQIAASHRFSLASMSVYDEHYVRYHTGVRCVRSMPVTCAHIPLSLRVRDHQPTNRIVLIGPSHNVDRLLHFDHLDELNRESAAFASARGLEPYTFAFIKQLYPHGQATFERLARHPAVVIFPYSAFSISMVELYELNLPFFVPDDESLVDRMDDVRLHPLYQSAEDVAHLDAHTAATVSREEYPHSPHDTSAEAQRWWLKQMYFNQVRHAVRFGSSQQLFERLYSSDLSALAARMREENSQHFEAQIANWRDWLQSV